MISAALADIFREEARRALGREVSPATIGADLRVVLSSLSPDEARVFASRIHDAALEYLVEMDPVMAEMKAHGVPAVPERPEPDPSPAAPAAESETPPAPAEAVGSEEAK